MPSAEVSFVTTETEGVRSLSGWKKTHRVPDRVSDSAQEFVAGLAASDLKKDLDNVFNSLSAHYKFARREMQTGEPQDGAGSIITPHFAYSVSVALNPDDPSEVIWARMVDGISSPVGCSSDAFGKVFDGMFDTLEFSLLNRIKLEDFVDAIEAANLPGVDIHYDRECTFCDLQIAAIAGVIRLTTQTLSVRHSRPQKTKALIKSFEEVKSLVLKSNVPSISFGRF